ncbi:MAG: hypothetical protein P8Y23_13475, partial [Candidatus Lokiarchaeota archaeon]
YDYVHIILSLYIFGKYPRGIGRYRLGKELGLGSGTVRSLMDKLKKENINFIEVTNSSSKKEIDQKKKGHILTKKGLDFLRKFKKKIPLIEKVDYSILKSIIIESENISTFMCLVRGAADKIGNGVEQRDAAIKINGLGATCLIYDGQNLTFPLELQKENEQNKIQVNQKIMQYMMTKLVNANLQFQKGDVIIIGLGNNVYKARLAALNAAQIPNKALQDDYFYHYIANKFSCIKSDRKSAVSFLIVNIEELHQIILKSRAGLDIKERTRLISIFHSHPSGNHPSMTDIENMKFLDTFSDIDHKFVSKAFKNLIWLIMDGTLYELNGFIYLNRSLYQIEIKIN